MSRSGSETEGSDGGSVLVLVYTIARCIIISFA